MLPAKLNLRNFAESSAQDQFTGSGKVRNPAQFIHTPDFESRLLHKSFNLVQFLKRSAERLVCNHMLSGFQGADRKAPRFA